MHERPARAMLRGALASAARYKWNQPVTRGRETYSSYTVGARRALMPSAVPGEGIPPPGWPRRSGVRPGVQTLRLGLRLYWCSGSHTVATSRYRRSGGPVRPSEAPDRNIARERALFRALRSKSRGALPAGPERAQSLASRPLAARVGRSGRGSRAPRPVPRGYSAVSPRTPRPCSNTTSTGMPASASRSKLDWSAGVIWPLASTNATVAS